MKKHYFSFIFFHLWLLFATIAFGQPSLNNQGTIHFRFLDPVTGFAIKGGQVAYPNKLDFMYVAADEKGEASLSLPKGRYTFSFSAEGYKPMKSHFEVKPANTLNVEVYLDRTQAPQPQQNAENKVLINGYVKDSESNMPLSGVEVSIPTLKVKTLTNEAGYFQYEIPCNALTSPDQKPTRVSFVCNKLGYKQYKNNQILLIPGVLNLRFELEAGKGTNEYNYEEGVLDRTKDTEISLPPPTGQKILGEIGQGGGGMQPYSCTSPSSIRVGYNCSCTSCSNVAVVSMATYVGNGLDDEWIASWNSNSLKAGAVAYRSYGAYYVNNPVNSNYDIANTTCNQVYNGTTSYSSCINAESATSNEVLEENGSTSRSEYSAENNMEAPCSDGYTGNGSSQWQCSSDWVCTGYSNNGHGRGMCQWGSQRWANNQGQGYTWILDHYYNVGGIYRCTGGSGGGSSCSVPSNNTCPSATYLGVYSSCNYTSATSCGATNSNIGSCVGTQDDDVWFYFTANGASTTINVQGSSGYDAVFQVLSSPCSGNMIAYGCIDNSGSGGLESATISTTAGTQYYVRVWEYYVGYGTTGDFDICITSSGSGGGGNLPNLYQVTSSASASGNSITLDVTVGNNGSATANSSTLGYFVSTDPNFANPQFIGSDYISSLSAGATSSASITVDLCNAGFASGTYYAGYYVDYYDDVTESDETDNGYWYFGSYPFTISCGGGGTTYYTINTSANPTNGGSATGGGSFASGQYTTVTASANSGYTFTNWTENGNIVSTSTSYGFYVTANRNLVANFTQQSQNYSINTSANPTNGGSATGGGSFASGQYTTLTASANSGYTFTNWTENGNVVSTTTSYGFSVTASRNLVANFTQQSQNYSINTSANPTNGGSATGGGSFASGQYTTLTASANSGYTFTNWTENGNVVSTSTTYGFYVTANRNLVANFTQQSQNYSINTSANPTNGGSATGGGSFASGQYTTLTASANSGYTFTNWTENGNVVSTSTTYGFYVTASRNLVANFTQQSQNYTVNTSANPMNGGSTYGSGLYMQGGNATVIAVNTAGWAFLNWAENGMIVSTNPSYNFLVNANRNLVANFYPTTAIEMEQEAKLQVVPNPNNGDFLLNSPLAIQKIRIFDETAREITAFSQTPRATGVEIHFANANEGIYFMEISFQNGKVYYQKIMIRL